MTSHAAPAGEMMMPPGSPVPPLPQSAARAAAVSAPSLSRGTAALDWIAPVRTWQTVAWEAATLAAAAGHGRSAVTEYAAYAGAGALIGVSSLRIHGRCLGQWAETQGRYRGRRLSARRRGTAEDAAGAAALPLAALMPDLGLGGYVDRAGNRVGLAASDGGWVAAVRLGPTVEPDVGALLAVLRETFADPTIPLASAQLVVWTSAGVGPVGTGSAADGSSTGSDTGSSADTGTGAGNTPDPGPNPPSPPDLADLTATAVHSIMPPGGFPAPDLDRTVTLATLNPAMVSMPPSQDLDMTITLPVLSPSVLAAAAPGPAVPNTPFGPGAPTGAAPVFGTGGTGHSGNGNGRNVSSNGTGTNPGAQSGPGTAPGTTPGPAPSPHAAPGPMRVYWLALRYRPRQAPHAALARGGGELGAARAVAGSALSLVARLDSAGYPADALDQMELGQELLVALNAGDPTPSEVEETWRDWSSGRLRQVCFEPHRSLDPAAMLEQWTPGAAFTCSSYTLSRTPRGRIRGSAAIRIAGADVADLVPPVPAVRANGRHQEFVLRTLPLAVN